MAAVLTLAKKGFPTPWTAAGVAEHINLLKGERVISVSWVDSNTVSSKDKRVASSLEIDGTTLLGTEKVMSKLLVRYAEELGYIDTGVVEWVRFVGEKMAKPSQDRGYVFEVLDEFDHHLAMRSFFVGYTVTAADLAIWGALRQSPVFQAALKEAPSPVGANLLRWYKFVNAMPFAASVMDTFSGSSKASETNKADQGSFDLSVKDLEYGKVCTRFPPEPSGYLHIGHAKAALLNEYIAHTNGGKLLIRFDDTNPTKEKMEYQDAIIADLELLGIKGDAISYTSDYFDVLYDYAIRAINEGIAYVDDTDQKTMQHERMHGIASKSRDLSVEENLKRFEEMKQGTEFGQKCCLRAKMS
ncbi:glutamate--tRNA ligase, partial [Spiromyces aspiralis]